MLYDASKVIVVVVVVVLVVVVVVVVVVVGKGASIYSFCITLNKSTFVKSLFSGAYSIILLIL